MLKIEKMILGPISNNTFIVYDDETKETAVIDPAITQDEIYQKTQELGLTITQIWLTHPHFDHTGGIAYLLEICNPAPQIFLHKNGVQLWEEKGGAKMFNFPFPQLPTPKNLFSDKDKLTIGAYEFEIIETPGHTESDSCFYNSEHKILFSGDVLFSRSIGRTDLPGGDSHQLINNIKEKLFILPDDTVVYPGHGALTTIGREKKENPFL